MKHTVIDIKHLTFSYGPTNVLKDVNLSLAEGDFLGLVGPNGSGKSTLLKCIVGLQQPQHGQVLLYGQSVSRFRDWSRIGYVSQKASHFNTSFPATVFEVVSTGLYGKVGLFKWLSSKDKQTVHETIERVGLSKYRQQKVGALSGGQQQRVFMARALVSNPDLLILDEPTVGVDTDSVQRFYRLLAQFRDTYQLTILLVSHDIGVLTSQVNQVACLNKRIRYYGDPEQFVTQQQDILSETYGHNVSLIHHVH